MPWAMHSIINRNPSIYCISCESTCVTLVVIQTRMCGMDRTSSLVYFYHSVTYISYRIPTSVKHVLKESTWNNPVNRSSGLQETER